MKKDYLLITTFLSVSAVALLAGLFVKKQQSLEAEPLAINTKVITAKEPIYKYGLNLSNFTIIDQKVEKNELFEDILLKHNVAYQSAKYLINRSKEVFNSSHIKAGTAYSVLGENTDTGFIAKKIVYEESKLNYVVFNLDDSLYIYRGQNKVKRYRQEVAGIINGSLYESFSDMNVPASLAVKLAEIFASTVDFYKIKQGDKFKIVYDQDFVEDRPIGVGDIIACIFNSAGKDYYAFNYSKSADEKLTFYDEQGNSMRKQFLKSPLKFFQITSRFNLHRFHPVAMEWRAHLGTDYAAAQGTPILATADGVVEEAQYGVYNGNYVKIRHNGQYKTQYLHMSRIGKGMRHGRAVKQGEVIGYVGSTGLATGPHVCYRFWKDGQQVDPFRQKLQFSEPLIKKFKANYIAKISPLKSKMDALNYGTKPFLPAQEKIKTMQLAYNATNLFGQYF